MENFTPFSSILGGTLIGLSATLLFLSNGRIAGISGITNGLFTASTGDRAWRAFFLLGLILGAGSYINIVGLPFEAKERALPLLLTAGVLVGFGTRIGSGCTSGHAVCGIARLSKRSLIATLVFLATGMATVWIASYVTGA
ncbi:MAG: putative membrane protein YedE/YeeE [Halioglobus sp.]|jgi:uncharacterized membrane protein YedE/YeeE